MAEGVGGVEGVATEGVLEVPFVAELSLFNRIFLGKGGGFQLY